MVASTMSMSDITEPEIIRGLVGVYADETETTYIDGTAGILEYRGYNISSLAEQATFEEVAYLILYGELPTWAQLDEYSQQLKASRQLPDTIVDIIRQIQNAHPMDVLRTAVSALSALDEERDDNSVAASYRKGIRLTSQVATIVTTHFNLKSGSEPVAPRADLGHAANFLYMLTGKVPSAIGESLIDRDFVLHAEHGLNASAFTARVVTGTQADIHGAVTAAIAALSGPSHGGAAENVMKMVFDIGTPDNAAQYVADALAQRERIMGFGHRVYKCADPRAEHLREGVAALSREQGRPELFEILENIRTAMEPLQQKEIFVNVDFYAGVAYYLLGIPQELYVPIFAVGRLPGWTIQVVEQLQNNILIRPLLNYTGPRNRTYVPLDQR